MTKQGQRKMVIRDLSVKAGQAPSIFAVLLLFFASTDLHGDGPPPLELDDGSGRLTLGAMAEIGLVAEEMTELRFLADGPGMLTLAWGGELASIQLLLLNDNQQSLTIEHGRHPTGDTPVRHAIIPIGEAGAYRLQVTSDSTGTAMIGSAWMPFNAIQGGRTNSPAAPIPEPEDIVQVTPGQPQQPAVPRGNSDNTFLWLGHTAQADGQLALLFSADRGDLTLSVFREGSYAEAVEYVDSDMNGDATCEGVVLDMREGETFHIRVNDLTEQGVQTRLRSVWLDAPPHAAELRSDPDQNAGNRNESEDQPDN